MGGGVQVGDDGLVLDDHVLQLVLVLHVGVVHLQQLLVLVFHIISNIVR